MGDLTGPSPSVKSWGLKRADMAGVVSPQNRNLVTSWQFVHPHTLFMVERHLGKVISIVQ